MTEGEYQDRLQRLARRGERLLADTQRVSAEHRQLMQCAWQQSLAAAPGSDVAFNDPAAESRAVIAASKLDSILCLLERIARPAGWLDEQALWFDRARHCLADAVWHAAQVAGGTLLPPPILAIEPIDSPLYYPRVSGRPSFLPLATPAELPLPVVVCPGSILEEPWAWATLYHELGHHLDAAREDAESVRARLFDEEQQGELGSWPDWVHESIADLYAGLLGGQGAVDCLTSLLADKPYSSATHPAGTDRVTVLQAAWGSLRVGTMPAGNKATDQVARALAERFRPWQSLLQQEPDPVDGELTAARLMPGQLHRWRATGQAPEALRGSCSAAFAHLKRPEWSASEAQLTTLSLAMRHLVETRVQPGAEPWKLPPVDLLVPHETISLVGATHGQLLDPLREAMARRNGRPFALIELFALDDQALRKLTLGGRTGEALVAERTQSLLAIKTYLLECGVPHRQYLYAEPYLFASYWDVEDNEHRPTTAPPAHIHVSSALWGTDLRIAPGNDYEAAAGELLPMRMRRYVEALEQLRKGSVELS